MKNYTAYRIKYYLFLLILKKWNLNILIEYSGFATAFEPSPDATSMLRKTTYSSFECDPQVIENGQNLVHVMNNSENTNSILGLIIHVYCPHPRLSVRGI